LEEKAPKGCSVKVTLPMAFVSTDDMVGKLSVIGVVLNKDLKTIKGKRIVRTVPKVFR
jgi:hypothetical protein